MAKAIEFTDANFESEVLQSKEPVLVDFHAPWCGPCRAVGPTIDSLARENEGTVKVGKLNVDDNPSVASSFGIHSIPAVLMFHGGKVKDRIVGVQPKDRYLTALQSVTA